MPDEYGLLAFPVGAPDVGDAVSDPALNRLLEFLKAAANGAMTTAWHSVDPRHLPVESTFAHNPELLGFNDNKLPALFAYRKGGGGIAHMADEWRVETSDVTVLWVIESTAQAKQLQRHPAVNGITKAIDRAIDYGRDVAWIVASDRADPDGLKTSIATSTSAQSYSGAALNGALVGTTFDPPRRVIATMSAQAGAYSTAAGVVFTGTDKNGDALSATLTPTTTGGGATLQSRGWERFATITSIATPAQTLAAGAWTFGVGPSDDDLLDMGSLVRRHAGLMGLNMSRAGTLRMLQIRMDEGAPLTYYAVEFALTMQERLYRSPAAYATLGSEGDGTANLDILLSDGSIYESARLT